MRELPEAIVGAVLAPLRSRASLVAENRALGQQSRLGAICQRSGAAGVWGRAEQWPLRGALDHLSNDLTDRVTTLDWMRV